MLRSGNAILALLLASILLVSCGAQTPAAPAVTTEVPSASPATEAAEVPTEPTPEPEATPEPGRYQLSAAGECILDDVDLSAAAATEDNARVFYEIFVGSFSDSNGDGIGDLRGIINRMDYLNDGDPASGLSLGVEGLWLTPIFRSRSYHKYNVADYYEIDPAFGTQKDLDELIALCHARNVKLILDLPINHTDLMNSWFSEFTKAHRSGDTESPYYDFYCYYDKDTETAPVGRSFAQLSGTNHYFECNFSGDMPELNFDNELVREETLNVGKFYLEKGVDGFRFDAAKYIYYGDNQRSAEFWDWYIAELKAVNPQGYFIAEVWDGDGITDIYYSSMNCFNFTLSQTSGLIAETAKGGNSGRYVNYVESYLNTVKGIRDDAMIAPFITNHDMDRAAGFLTEDTGNIQMAANLYLLTPGSPFIYYGEELGMRGSRGGANTDANRRLAMEWGDGDTIADPEGSTYPAGKRVDHTAAEQLGDDDSLYNYYKKVLLIRQANPEIARGEMHALTLTGRMGGFTSTWNGSTVCVLHNTTGSTITVSLSELGDFSTVAAFVGMGEASIDGTELSVGPHTSAVLR